MDDAIRNLILQAIDQTISSADFERLQNALERDDGVCQEYLRAVGLSDALSEMAVNDSTEPDAAPSHRATDLLSQPAEFRSRSRHFDLRSPQLLTCAIAILLLVSSTAYWFGQHNATGLPTSVVTNRGAANRGVTNDGVSNGPPASATESLIAGHATLRRSVDLIWPADSKSYRDGDVLPDGELRFDAGVAEIDFFCGATLIVEGPANLTVESDWSVRVVQGRLRANVPPAARGFIVKAADSEIVDLGTEFALEVGTENARVEVLDGEIVLRGGEFDGEHLLTGQQQLLKGTAQSESFAELSTLNDLQHRRDDAATQRFQQWKVHSKQLRTDNRLIAYYPITETRPDRVVVNAAATGSLLDGKLTGPVERAIGRFGAPSAGLEFDRPGSRVRTRIDGEFPAFTFTCWVRIDSLEHVYNALFMSDGYQTGELHWQIQNDGRLMFSVMVDDTQSIRHFSKVDQRVVETAGLAHIYYSKPFWDVSKAGQWFHLAAVYDPVNRRVTQYVNGELFGDEKIVDRFHIDRLRIGPAEIGNWGQPFRKTPWFSVRNLNGTIDELAIYNQALPGADVETLYEQGKPLGY